MSEMARDGDEVGVGGRLGVGGGGSCDTTRWGWGGVGWGWGGLCHDSFLAALVPRCPCSFLAAPNQAQSRAVAQQSVDYLLSTGLSRSRRPRVADSGIKGSSYVTAVSVTQYTVYMSRSGRSTLVSVATDWRAARRGAARRLVGAGRYRPAIDRDQQLTGIDQQSTACPKRVADSVIKGPAARRVLDQRPE
jgi:hypothetical protein